MHERAWEAHRRPETDVRALVMRAEIIDELQCAQPSHLSLHAACSVLHADRIAGDLASRLMRGDFSRSARIDVELDRPPQARDKHATMVPLILSALGVWLYRVPQP